MVLLLSSTGGRLVCFQAGLCVARQQCTPSTRRRCSSTRCTCTAARLQAWQPRPRPGQRCSSSYAPWHAPRQRRRSRQQACRPRWPSGSAWTATRRRVRWSRRSSLATLMQSWRSSCASGSSLVRALQLLACMRAASVARGFGIGVIAACRQPRRAAMPAERHSTPGRLHAQHVPPPCPAGCCLQAPRGCVPRWGRASTA